MNIHEYQAKELFRSYGVPVPAGVVVSSSDEARALVQAKSGIFGGTSSIFAVKAQIHAGGRGKAGGVKIAKNMNDIPGFVDGLLGKTLVTHQTGTEGRLVRKVWIEEGASIAREFYLSLVLDRSSRRISILASTEGGMEIEEVSESHPEKILTLAVDPEAGCRSFVGRRVASFLGLPVNLYASFATLLANLFRFFVETDCMMVEINPLILTGDGRLLALDGKVSFDDNALYRQEKILALRDLFEENDLEIEASKHKLNYVKLDGSIACMVNGAGLAMATMDVIALAGGSPANFLDVGGGASKETVEQAFRILLGDPAVKGIFVNIFGGIVRCERIAGGIIAAAKDVKLHVPLVVRLQGTNAKEGREMLKESGLNLQVAEDLFEGAEKIVLAVKGAK
ncbi:MAG: ADP-forming succinate--CoA ligase subunit beta [Nitrospirota bacterium]|nr:ADP-forming succinate--CoA ligase subunit beta [Nitrospirota bacterium]